MQDDDGFDKAFGVTEEDLKPEPPAAPQEPSNNDEANGSENNKTPEGGQAPEEPKKDEATPPSGDEGEKKKEPEQPTPPETPPAPEEPKPLTLDDIKSVINDVRTEERVSSQALETTTKEVLEAYYPDGLSNTLVDENGKELKTPQDVVDATNGEMTTEQAAQWLMNEQYKLDQQVASIKDKAKEIAETTLNFKRDAIAAVQKYEPLFAAYEKQGLQKKVFDIMMKQVKADTEKNVILSAPDVMDLYDTFLEPYRLAYEHSQQQPATNPNTPPNTPPPATPGAEDRLDEGGDGGSTPPDDPNDFAQQVSKELAKGA
jgi:hypothetical protein